VDELLFNRLDHEVHNRDVVRNAVCLQATVKLLRDAGRQLRDGFVGLRHLCRLLLRSRRRSQTARGLREESVGRTSRRRSVTEAGESLPEPPAHEGAQAQT